MSNRVERPLSGAGATPRPPVDAKPGAKKFEDALRRKLPDGAGKAAPPPAGEQANPPQPAPAGRRSTEDGREPHGMDDGRGRVPDPTDPVGSDPPARADGSGEGAGAKGHVGFPTAIAASASGAASVAGGVSDSFGSGPGRVPREVVDALVRSVQVTETPGGASEVTVSIRGSGPYEGMTVHVTSKDGHVQARLVVETFAARQAVEADLPSLAQQMENRGSAVPEFRVELANPGHGGGLSGDAHGGSHGHQSQHHHEGTFAGDSSAPAEAARPSQGETGTDTSTDYTV